MDAKIQCIPPETAKAFAKKCMVAVGTAESHAQTLADALVTADTRGHFSHGINRLHMYINDVKSGVTVKEGLPVVVKESSATALVDGRNNLGPVVGDFSMKIAIQKARESGIGWVCARGSNHYGIAGFYALQALEHGLVGFSFTNSTPCLQATRAKEYTLGSNPICCAAPGLGKDAFVLDMATSTVAYGKIEVNHVKGVGIPNGWGADSNGKVTTDPAEVLNGGGLLPLGGAEESGSYKGYGLAMMVEVLCGIMAGATYGPKLRTWGTTERVADLGQCFIALDPSKFADGFGGRMQDMIDIHRNLEPSNPDKPVLVPGDPEREHVKKCEDMGGIPYPSSIVDHVNGFANDLGVGKLHG